MPVHDWTRVDAGIFHDFHQAWNAELRSALNGGLLPTDYYALIEQHAGRHIPDLLTLHTRGSSAPLPETSGGVALAEVRSRISRRLTAPTVPQRRTIAIRHVSGHRLIALIEVASPSNKDRAESVRAFADKAAEAIHAGVHVVVIDLFPPGPYDPQGMHAVIWSQFDQEAFTLPPDKPLTLSSYVAEWPLEALVEHRAVGDDLPAMPLPLTAEKCVLLPLTATYEAAFRTEPTFWREVLEGKREAANNNGQ